MRTYFMFGTIAILSFLGCIYFLSSPGMYRNVAAASYQPITNLTSSVSIIVTPEPAIAATKTDSLPVIAAMQSPEAFMQVSKETVISTPVTSSLLSAPIVSISSGIDDADSSVFADAVPLPSKTAIRSYITQKQETGTDNIPVAMLQGYIDAITGVAEKYHYSDRYAFLVNLGMKSGKRRFFVIDLQNGTVIKRGLVAHGQGKKRFTLDKSYSNNPGSGCSSLGFYRVGSAYNGGYGPSFKLTGLSKTNTNAARRAIVLHAMNCIPDEETDYPICQSEGCPSLSTQFFSELSSIIKSQKKPILLWMFDPAVNPPVEN